MPSCLVHIWPISLLFLLALILFLPAWLKGNLMAGGDIELYFAPWHQWIRSEILSGRLPLWNPNILCGVPVAANPQVGLFYPPNLLLRLFPVPFGINLLLMFHLVLMGVGMYVYLLHHKLRPVSGLTGAIAFMLSGFSIPHLYAGHFTFLCTVAWMPFLLLLAERLLDPPHRIKDASLFALILCLQLLGGHFQIPYMTLEAVGILAVIRSIGLLGKRPNKSLGHLWLVLIAAVIWALVMAGIQLVPSWELMKAGARGAEANVPFASEHSFHPSLLITFLFPNAFGSPATGDYQGPSFYWEVMGFVGITALFFVFIALAKPSNAHRLFLISLTLLGFCLALGKYSPLYQWAYELIPGFSRFRAPSRHILLVTFGLAALAGHGLNDVGEILSRYRQRVLLAIPWGMCAILAAELLYFALPFSQGVSPSKILQSFGEVGKRLREESSWFRVFPVGLTHPNSSSMGNILGLWEGVRSLQGYDPLISKRYRDYVGVAEYRQSSREEQSYLNFMRFSSPLALELGARYVLCLAPAALQDRQPVWSNSSMAVYEQGQALPRAMLLDRGLPVSNQDAALEQLMRPDFDPSRTVILEMDGTSLPSTLNAEGATATIIEDTPTRISLDVQSPGDAVLRVSEATFAGWKAFLDGQRVPLLTADLILRAVVVPAGSHRVEFVYHPFSVWMGGLLSLTGLLSAGAILWTSWRRQKGKG